MNKDIDSNQDEIASYSQAAYSWLMLITNYYKRVSDDLDINIDEMMTLNTVSAHWLYKINSKNNKSFSDLVDMSDEDKQELATKQQEEDLQYASSFKPKKVTITSVSGDEKVITDLVQNFYYFENITMPTLEAVAVISDSGGNLIASLPIQGYEDIEITLEGQDEEEIVYNFKVYRVFDRFSADRVQVYKLGMISKEALINETIRLPKLLTGKPDGIVVDMLTNYLNTTKEIKTDPTLFKIRFNPGKKTPFSIINNIKDKSVAQDANNKTSSKTGGSETDSTGVVPDIDSGSYGKMSGSAGYLFYENYDGYNFNSIDRLNSLEKNPPVIQLYQENDELIHSKLNKISNIDMKNTDTFIKKNNYFSARRSLRLKHDDYGRNISIIMIN